MLVASKVYCQRLQSILLQNHRQHRRSSTSFNHKNRAVIQITKDCITTLGIFTLRELPLSRASLLGCSGSFGSFSEFCVLLPFPGAAHWLASRTSPSGASMPPPRTSWLSGDSQDEAALKFGHFVAGWCLPHLGTAQRNMHALWTFPILHLLLASPKILNP